jgi:hypothetical protein
MTAIKTIQDLEQELSYRYQAGYQAGIKDASEYCKEKHQAVSDEQSEESSGWLSNQ